MSRWTHELLYFIDSVLDSLVQYDVVFVHGDTPSTVTTGHSDGSPLAHRVRLQIHLLPMFQRHVFPIDYECDVLHQGFVGL